MLTRHAHTPTRTHTGRHTDTNTRQTRTESKMPVNELYWPSVQPLSKQSFPGNNNKIKTSLVKYIYVQKFLCKTSKITKNKT